MRHNFILCLQNENAKTVFENKRNYRFWWYHGVGGTTVRLHLLEFGFRFSRYCDLTYQTIVGKPSTIEQLINHNHNNHHLIEFNIQNHASLDILDFL